MRPPECGDAVSVGGVPHRVAVVAVTLRWVALARADAWPRWPVETLVCCPFEAVQFGKAVTAFVVPWAERPVPWRYRP